MSRVSLIIATHDRLTCSRARLKVRAAPSDLGRVAEPDFVTEIFQQLFEPGAVTTGF
ncbi:MAG: hypothetical protein QOD33_23 [Pyrinomonadaceae bacterium]|nr:hypothetical protein [Pyrinomonadaceae bacterium]